MIPDTCKGKFVTLNNGLKMKSCNAVGLQTRIQVIQTYQAIKIVNGVNGRLEDRAL